MPLRNLNCDQEILYPTGKLVLVSRTDIDIVHTQTQSKSKAKIQHGKAILRIECTLKENSQ